MQRSRNSLTTVFLFTLLTVLSAYSNAQEAQAPTPSSPKESGKKGGSKTTTLNFEDELIEGEAKKPELFYLLQRKQFNFKKLIKLREDFLPEMRRTSEELRRGGGGKE